MKTSSGRVRRFAFSVLQYETELLVEVVDHEVAIKATRDTFSKERKLAFIRELAAEGFLESNQDEIVWSIDDSWIRRRLSAAQRTDRFMIRLLVAGGLCWLGMLVIMIGCNFSWK